MNKSIVMIQRSRYEPSRFCQLMIVVAVVAWLFLRFIVGYAQDTTPRRSGVGMLHLDALPAFGDGDEGRAGRE